MSAVRRNIVATFAGNACSALVSLAVVPVYVKLLGIEAYGLIGFFTTLQALIVVLDAGLSGTLTRELARLSGSKADAQTMRTLVRTLETAYWGIALVLGLGLVVCAPFITSHWLKTQAISASDLTQATVCMGLTIAIQWPTALYMGGLQGMQRHVELNFINTVVAIARSLITVLALWLISPTLQVFFIGQMIAAAAQTGILGGLLWRRLPPSVDRARFHAAELRRVWRFAAGMSGVTIAGLILMQLDKLVLSRTLSLEQFGYYMIAWTVATSLYRLTGPLFTAVFPRLSELHGRGDDAAIAQLYHRSSQLITVAVVPAAAILVAFAPELLNLWMHDKGIVAGASAVAGLLVIGTALNGLYNIPYALQLANGWTSLAAVSNVVSLVIYVPALFALTNGYGARGAAFAWIGYNAVGIVLLVPIMHRRILKNEKWPWYLEDVAMPAVAALLTALAFRELAPEWRSSFGTIAYIGVASIATLSASFLAAQRLRVGSLELFRRMAPGGATR